MKVTIAIDSFKECATSTELAKAIERGIEPFVDEICLVPISDGGEGTIETMAATFTGEKRLIKSVNPFGESIQEDYFFTQLNNVPTAVIESSYFVGIHYTSNRKSESYLGSSYGLGLAISDAIAHGIKQIILTLGGSGTTDGGLGLLQGLGAQLFDADHHLLPNNCPNPLLTTQHIELSQVVDSFKDISLIVANDVDNPYCGSHGAAKIFGPQKGLTDQQISSLDAKLTLIANDMLKQGFIDLNQTPGAGAAGGIGGALALLNGKMVSGFSLLADLIDLKKHLIDSDWVITGEGRLDAQSSAGKVPYGVAHLAKETNTRTLLLCGSYDEISEQELFDGIFSIQREATTLEQAMTKSYALKNIEMLSHQLFKILQTN